MLKVLGGKRKKQLLRSLSSDPFPEGHPGDRTAFSVVVQASSPPGKLRDFQRKPGKLRNLGYICRFCGLHFALFLVSFLRFQGSRGYWVGLDRLNLSGCTPRASCDSMQLQEGLRKVLSIWDHQKKICSGLPPFLRFVLLCVPFFQGTPGCVPICSDLFRCVFRTNQNRSGKPPSADPSASPR